MHYSKTYCQSCVTMTFTWVTTSCRCLQWISGQWFHASSSFISSIIALKDSLSFTNFIRAACWDLIIVAISSSLAQSTGANGSETFSGLLCLGPSPLNDYEMCHRWHPYLDVQHTHMYNKLFTYIMICVAKLILGNLLKNYISWHFNYTLLTLLKEAFELLMQEVGLGECFTKL